MRRVVRTVTAHSGLGAFALVIAARFTLGRWLAGARTQLRRGRRCVGDVRVGRTARRGATQVRLARSSASAFMLGSVSAAATPVCVPAHVDHGCSRMSRTLSLDGDPLQRRACANGSVGSDVETAALPDKLCPLWSPQQVAGWLKLTSPRDEIQPLSREHSPQSLHSGAWRLEEGTAAAFEMDVWHASVSASDAED